MSSELFMRRALELAAQAAAEGDVPVGAVVVHEGQIVGEGRNTRERDNDPTGHAEVVAWRAAASALGRWRLDDCALFVTLEPCTMCVGALVHARVRRVVFAASEPKAGALKSARALMDAEQSGYFNHRFEWQGGVLEGEASEMLSGFFKQRRMKL